MARILIVEDMALLAMELQDMVEDLGHEVVGVVGSVDTAIDALNEGTLCPEAVMLDADLRGVSSAPVARLLRERQIPFAVASGFGADALGSLIVDEPRLSKPIDKAQLDRVLGALTGNEGL